MAPTNQAAWIVEKGSKPLQVKDAVYASPGPDEIVVKNGAVAINPVDWKLQAFDFIGLPYPFVLGEDVAGEIVEVGSSVQEFKVGDKILGHSSSLESKDPKYGAFQSYTVIQEGRVAKIPLALSYADAAVLPLAISTAAAGLFEKDFLRLPLPSVPIKEPNGQVILVWGGSSSIGAVAIQLARAAGVEVFTTASPRNHEYVKELGASQVFDYASPTVVEDIIAAIGDKKLAGIFESISTAQSQALAGKIAQHFSVFLALSLWKDESAVPASVQAAQFQASSIHYNDVGKAIWRNFVPAALEQGILKVSPPAKIIGHGLDHVQAAFDANERGLSAEKAVVTLE